jgi:hypothetical protein
MRFPGFTVAFVALLGLAILVFAWFAFTRHPEPAAPTAAAAHGSSVTAGGTTLVSDSIILPDEKAVFPTGASGELITQHCTACHSPEMILNQPVLGAEKWKATVEKMRAAYHAPIAPADDPAIIAALTALQSPPAAKP